MARMFLVQVVCRNKCCVSILERMGGPMTKPGPIFASLPFLRGAFMTGRSAGIFGSKGSHSKVGNKLVFEAHWDAG